MTDCWLLLHVYSRMIRSHERRALRALLFLASRSESASPENCGLSAERRDDCVCASWLAVFVIQRIDRCILVLQLPLYVSHTAAAVYTRL